MKRIHQILATGFLALVLFLNIGLTLSMNFGLHAHFLGNNQILIHLHNSQGGEHSHSNSDCGTSANFVFSTTLTYLNDSEGIALKSSISFLAQSLYLDTHENFSSSSYHYARWRGPPVV
ncbi:hypothetical protein [Labilibacter marinus]|uniref:hypothetical protein n=1 Tax=Labilibacter marinus TaxID=1477105 RepID=UPI00094FA7B5|nr:hypothetical protein [Labilibacter marinus]